MLSTVEDEKAIAHASELLTFIRAQIAANPTLLSADREAFEHRCAQMLAVYYPFEPIRSKLAAHVQGNGYFGALMSAVKWSIDHCASETPVSDIIRLVAHDVKQNSGSFLEVTPVLGLTVNERVDIDEASYFCPPDQVPPSPLNNYYFNEYGPTGLSNPIDCAAFIQVVTVSPIYADNKDGVEKLSEKLKAQAAIREQQRRRVCLALVLAGTSTINMTATLVIPQSPTCYEFFGEGRGGRDFKWWLRNAIDLQAFAVIEEQLRAIASTDGILVAIERLNNSRKKRGSIDTLLDLGMSLEMALMQGSQGEIVHKMSLRGGWLLGSDPQSRLEISRRIKALYGLRSSVAHSGKAPAKIPDDFHILKADEMVCDAIKRLVEREAVVDWDLLVFGL